MTKRSDQQARQIFNKRASNKSAKLSRHTLCYRTCLLGLHQDLSFPYSAPPWLAGLRRAQLSLPPRLRPRPAPGPPPRVRPRPHPPALFAFSLPPRPWQPLCARRSRTSGPLWRGAAADRASARTPPTLCLPPAEPPVRAPAFLTGGRVRVRRLHTQRPPALRRPRPAAACAGPASASPRSSRCPQPGLPRTTLSSSPHLCLCWGPARFEDGRRRRGGELRWPCSQPQVRKRGVEQKGDRSEDTN